jgi:hypothetical protein
VVVRADVGVIRVSPDTMIVITPDIGVVEP